MTHPEIDARMMAGAAREIAAKINGQLEADFTAQTIMLTREEAIIALGAIEGAIVQLEREAAGKP